MRGFLVPGSGVSAESGLGTFRDKGGTGIWTRFDPMKLATPEAFVRDPQEVYAFYNARRRNLTEFANDAASMHPARPIDRLGPTDQHFLGIAAAQRAGSAERAMVDHRHQPARAHNACGRHLRGSTGADDNEVVAVHRLPFATLFAVQAESDQPDSQNQRRNHHILSLG